MSQIFSKRANAYFRQSLIIGGIGIAITIWVIVSFARSDYISNVGEAVVQPVPFSHRHHARGLGIDCRYCHVGVEKYSHAGLPETEICMTCHSQIWTESVTLEPVRRSYESGEAIAWQRIVRLPEFVFFNHSIHV